MIRWRLMKPVALFIFWALIGYIYLENIHSSLPSQFFYFDNSVIIRNTFEVPR